MRVHCVMGSGTFLPARGGGEMDAGIEGKLLEQLKEIEGRKQG